MKAASGASTALPLPSGTWLCIVCDEPQQGAPLMAASGKVPACEWCAGQTATVARVFSDDHQATAHGDGCPCPKPDERAS